MDDDLRQFETELKTLRPAAPSRELAARIERDLATSTAERAPAKIHWLWVAALPAAAVIALVATRFSPAVAPRPEPAVQERSSPVTVRDTAAATVNDAPLKPVAAENLLVAASDEGLVTLEDGTQARRERRHYVDTITWKNPRSNASLTWSVPREEVRVVPIAFQ